MRQQGKILEHHAHAVAAQLDKLGVGDREQILALELDLPIGRFDEPRHAADKRRLARAREAHDDENLALADFEIDRARRADQPGLYEFGGTCPAVVIANEPGGIRAEKLPDIAAGKLDGA